MTGRGSSWPAASCVLFADLPQQGSWQARAHRTSPLPHQHHLLGRNRDRISGHGRTGGVGGAHGGTETGDLLPASRPRSFGAAVAAFLGAAAALLFVRSFAPQREVPVG